MRGLIATHIGNYPDSLLVDRIGAHLYVLFVQATTFTFFFLDFLHFWDTGGLLVLLVCLFCRLRGDFLFLLC